MLGAIAGFTIFLGLAIGRIGREPRVLRPLAPGYHRRSFERSSRNLSEGLAIGQSAAAGDINLAVLLIIGFGLLIGTLIGQSLVNHWLSLASLSLAAGSILYVVIELLGVANKLGYKDILCWSLVAGLFFGFATDMVLLAADA